MGSEKQMIIRGARIIQQMVREGILDEASTYQNLERRTVAGFPNTTKRQFAVQPIQIVRMEFIPYVPTGNLRCDAIARSGEKTYEPQILFNNVEYQDEDTPQNVTFKASTGDELNILPIDLSQNTCKVRCTCLDFYHRFSEYNYSDDSLYGGKMPTYQRKTTTRPDANPNRTPGICKHIMKTILALREAGMIRR